VAALGNYIVAVRDRLIALHEADAAWKGATSADRDKVRSLNIVVRSGGRRQNVKRDPRQALPPGWTPLADFRFLRLGPGPQQQNPFGTMRTFGNASADTPACGGVIAETLVYRVSYRVETEDVATALLTASQRIITAARNQLANANATPALAALSYVNGAALVSAQAADRNEGGTWLVVLDTDIGVNVRLTTADITG
jgi:hypothetical protein